MENNALAIEKIQGNKNESSLLPGNTRSSLNGIKSSCTLGGKRGREGKQQLVGDTAREGDTAAWQAGNCGEGTSQRDVAHAWFPVVSLREIFFLSCPVISKSTPPASNFHPMQCHLHKNVENVTNSSRGSTGLCEL